MFNQEYMYNNIGYRFLQFLLLSHLHIKSVWIKSMNNLRYVNAFMVFAYNYYYVDLFVLSIFW